MRNEGESKKKLTKNLYYLVGPNQASFIRHFMDLIN